MPFESTILGRTGLKVGRMGISAAYGAPAKAIEEAFEHQANYFYWGELRRGRQDAHRGIPADKRLQVKIEA
jgi:hypothetical protein